MGSISDLATHAPKYTPTFTIDRIVVITDHHKNLEQSIENRLSALQTEYNICRRNIQIKHQSIGALESEYMYTVVLTVAITRPIVEKGI